VEKENIKRDMMHT